MPRNREAGFSMIELSVTLAVLLILLVAALPSFQGSLRSNRVSAASNELLASIALARSEAIRSTRGAGVCASATGISCGGTWTNGWLVFVDANANGAMDAGENVVRYSQGTGKLAMVGTANTFAFDPRGRVIGGAQSVGIKPDGHELPARCVFMGATGQARVEGEAC